MLDLLVASPITPLEMHENINEIINIFRVKLDAGIEGVEDNQAPDSISD